MPGVELDHIINRAQWPSGQPGIHGFHPIISNPQNNLQLLCKMHHKLKTDTEKRGTAWH